MPPAIQLRIIEGDVGDDAIGSAPPVFVDRHPLRAANDLPDQTPPVELASWEAHPTGIIEASDRRVFFRLFLFSLLIHAGIVAATMRDNPFGEERSAGGTGETIMLEGISVEMVDSVPGSGASQPQPLAEAKVMTETAVATAVADTPTENTAATEAAEAPASPVAMIEPEMLDAPALDDYPEPVVASAASAVADRIAAILAEDAANVAQDNAASAPTDTTATTELAPVAEAIAPDAAPTAEATPVAPTADQAVAASPADATPVTEDVPTAVAEVAPAMETLAEATPAKAAPVEPKAVATNSEPASAVAIVAAPSPTGDLSADTPAISEAAPAPVADAATPVAAQVAPSPVETPVAQTATEEATPPRLELPPVAEVQPPAPHPPTPATGTPATEVATLSDPLVPMDAPLPRPRPAIEKETPKPAAKVAKRAPAKKPAPVRRAAPQPVPVAPAPEPSPLAPFFASGGPPATGGSVAQQTGRASQAGNGGSAGVNKDAQGRVSVSSYRAKAYAHLRRFKSYPAEARQQGIRGTATVSFTLDANGRVLRVALAGSSGSALLDNAALAMVRRASPFPPIPPGIGATTTIRAPVNFAIGR